MTEQDLYTLKTLLESSKGIENSEKLDAKILAASLEYAPKPDTLDSSWYRLFPLDSLATLALSLTICFGALFSMSQIISPVEPNGSDSLGQNTSSQLNLEIAPYHSQQSLTRDGTLDEIGTTKKPVLPPEFGSRTTQDQILTALELPSAQALLEGKEFSFADERSLAEITLRGALADINQMLASGAFNQARDRYDRLRQSCAVCELPNSLEALALTSKNSTSRI